ncbi:nuclear transport factor 2 family protein [Actinoplanes sp. NPDC049265]|uniref:nuclear transport factor 2 family protein n=1 Tax=Actinoplanes sp. NPDC049265 TaxID=3363902 RepID=UPI003722760D
MSDIDQLVARYLGTWNDSDPARRRAEIEAVWEPDGQYVDPFQDVTGPDQIDAMIGDFQARFPGSVFWLLGPIDAHHRQVRFGWAFGPEGGDPTGTGMDVLIHTPNGRLAKLYGFFDGA